MCFLEAASANTLACRSETWGSRWLAKEREAEEAGTILSSAWMKIAFKDAVESIYRFKRWLKGRSWPNVRCSAVWCKLKKKVSKDEEDEREARADKRRRGNAAVLLPFSPLTLWQDDPRNIPVLLHCSACCVASLHLLRRGLERSGGFVLASRVICATSRVRATR